MNFLAHIYLSEELNDLSIGNFIADSIKGSQFQYLPEQIQKGIIMHRAIDTYTDQHHIHKRSRKRLDDKYGHYKGVIIDIFYDHFLAKHWLKYHQTPLAEFSQEFYQLLERRNDVLPEKILHLMNYMIPQNWLYNYQFFDGLQQVMNGMNRRTKGKSKMDESIVDLKSHYVELEQDFFEFFENLITFSSLKLTELNDE
ncbi:acyl carrier protein phosphodiesterase [Flavobacteriaceae bacterium]|nr:acyl carrier protein phosphodiesterase [Flavobacteriaceae bacterium]